MTDVTIHHHDAQHLMVLDLLHELRNALHAIEPNADHDTMLFALTAAQRAAERGAWQDFAAWMNGVQSFLVILSPVHPCGARALELGRSIIRVTPPD
ncbi:hypothetical protein GCM10008955_41420 [Deinococcus malanensis]|uniref:Uncharacterized protein n=1 Tax=Deinococcus malanensis TaxID=1706855 RepID=A0ABQ2F249_9DEIO|nr:hypothetical protein [Deinococcus malanensis]GGK43374.1 hypothetical protein GCM10008955_41420 [Deinococcus malanensis]